MFKMKTTIIAGFLFLATALFSQNLVLEINHPPIGEITYKGFVLQQERTVHIVAYGAGFHYPSGRMHGWMRDPSGMFAYAWILNADNRRLVWRMSWDNTHPARKNRYRRIFEGNVRLPAGKYEVYYYANEPRFPWLFDGFFSLGKLLEYLLRGEREWETALDELSIKISFVDQVFSQEAVRNQITQQQRKAIVSITGLGDSEYRREMFQLNKEGEFEIYGVGEAFDQEEFDYGWITLVNGGEKKIWEMSAATGEYAGGARKNRQWRETIRLAPGQYRVYFVTDDSHSPEEWNANPPYDPFYWGITVKGVPHHYDPNSIEKMEVKELPPLVDLTHLGNNENVEETFQVTKPTSIRIQAIGEGEDGEMYDYGWIENTDSGVEVWRMRYRDTFHAGGARKNRGVDTIIRLQPGTYTVHFVTDDSHAYHHWNAAPPYNPSHWGIMIFPVQKKDSLAVVPVAHPTSPVSRGNILIQMVRVRNDEHRKHMLELSRPTRIRIYAIGEGDWDEMYDYAWIENAHTGEVVWEMTYEDSHWAGGARKNRQVNTEITLPAGKYMVHYVTDDSHAYRDWNAEPPRDPEHYGITIFRLSPDQKK